jgi:hypothetical protein
VEDILDVVQRLSGARYVPCGDGALREVEQHVHGGRLAGRKLVARTPQQIRAARMVTTRQGAATGTLQMRRGTATELARMVVALAQLHQAGVRLLQVEAQERVVVDIGHRLRPNLQPIGHPLVQPGAFTLEQPVIGGVPDHHMGELVSVLSQPAIDVRADQRTGLQREKVITDTCRDSGRGQLKQRATGELLTHDSGALDHHPVVIRQPVQTRGQQGMDGRRDGDLRRLVGSLPGTVMAFQHAVVHKSAKDLRHEQRVSLGDTDDVVDQSAVDGAREQALGEQLALDLTERPHHEDVLVGRPSRQLRPRRAQLGSRHHQDQHRRGSNLVAQMHHQVDEGGLGPVHVVQDDDQRAPSGCRLHQPADRPERLVFRGGGADAHHAQRHVDHGPRRVRIRQL